MKHASGKMALLPMLRPSAAPGLFVDSAVLFQSFEEIIPLLSSSAAHVNGFTKKSKQIQLILTYWRRLLKLMWL
jgi:hypothetical protein